MVIQNIPSDLAVQDNLYHQVATDITRLVDQGTLRPGERIPSVRKLSRQREVSVATVLHAYRLLESRGVIEARPQSGYYVRARAWNPPAEPAISKPRTNATKVKVGELVTEVMQALRDPALVRLGASMAAPELFPTLQLNRTMAAVARRNPELANRYDPPPGNATLRQQIARRALETGCVLSPEELVTTCGCTEALHLALRAVAKPGDTIGIESPTFFGILQIIESLGMKACEVPTFPRDGICLDELEKRLKRCKIKACLFSLNFSNPLGSCMPDEKKKRLVEMLADYDVPLIEDDIYGHLSFDNVRPRTAKSFDRNGMVLLCDSITKILAPGYRVGWCAPGKFQARVEYLKIVTTSANPSLPQMAVAEFLANASMDHHIRRLRRFYEDQLHRMTAAVSRYFPAGTLATRPKGGQVLWVELPKRVDAMDLYRRALEEKISIAPGPMFSATGKFKNCVRLNCGNPWSEVIERAMLRLGQLAG